MVDFSDATGIAGTLEGMGFLPDDAARAVNSFSNIPPNAANAVLHMAETGSVDVGTVAPVLAMGLAATGVGAPAAAVVSAVLPAAQAILGALGLFQGGNDQHFDWYVGQTGFKGPTPSDPTDPLWKRIDSFLPPLPKPNSTDDFATQTKRAIAYGAFPEYIYIENDLYDMSIGGGKYKNLPKGAQDFAKALFGAWKANAERQINGHKGATLPALLQAVHSGWERSHTSGPTYTFSRGDLGNFSPANYAKPNSPFVSNTNFIELLLGGVLDKNREAPLTIHVGTSDISKTKTIPLKVPSNAQIASVAKAASATNPSHAANILSNAKNRTSPAASKIVQKSTPWGWLALAGLAIGTAIAYKR